MKQDISNNNRLYLALLIVCLVMVIESFAKNIAVNKTIIPTINKEPTNTKLEIKGNGIADYNAIGSNPADLIFNGTFY